MRNFLPAVVCASLLVGCLNAGVDSVHEFPPLSGDDAGQVGDGGAESPDLGPSNPSTSIQAFASFWLKSVSPNEVLKSNTSYEFTFEMNIQSNQDEQLQLVPRIDTGWSAVVKGADKIDVTTASAIDGLKVTKTIIVTTGPAGMSSLVLNLNGTKFSQFNQSSQPTRIAVGGMPLAQSDDILYYFSNAIGSQSEFRDNTLFVKRQQSSSQYVLSVGIRFKHPGSYTVSAPVAEPLDWQAERTTADTVNIGPGGSSYTTVIRFTPSSSGNQVTTADGGFRFDVAAADGHVGVPFSAQLKVVDKLPTKP